MIWYFIDPHPNGPGREVRAPVAALVAPGTRTDATFLSRLGQGFLDEAVLMLPHCKTFCQHVYKRHPHRSIMCDTIPTLLLAIAALYRSSTDDDGPAGL